MDRSHRAPRSFVAGSFSIAVLLLAGFSQAASAAPVLSDTFAENTQESFWYMMQTDPHNVISDVNERLEYTSDGAGANGGAGYVLRNTQIDVTHDFAVQVGWHYAAGGGNYLSLNLVYCVNGGGGKNMRLAIEPDGHGGAEFNSRDNDLATTATDGTFYFSYSAAIDRLYVSVNGYGMPASSSGDWVYDGVLKGQWGATSVPVLLLGGSGKTVVTSGEAYFTNFEITEGVMLIPGTSVMTINSTLSGTANSVAIQECFSPDNNGLSASGTTPFNRTLDKYLPLFLSAPTTDGHGNAFSYWELDGVGFSTSPVLLPYEGNVNVTTDQPHTVTAVYGATAPLFQDTFTGNTLASWWYNSTEVPTTVNLKQANNQLELLSSVDPSGYRDAICQLRGRWLSMQSDFHVQVDWGLSDATGSNDVGLSLIVAGNSGNHGQIEAEYNSLTSHEPGANFNVQGYSNGSNAFSGVTAYTSRSATSGTLYISYDATNDILCLSSNGYDLPSNPSAGNWEIDGVVQNGWGNNAAILINGWVNNIALFGSEAYFDNFAVTEGTFVTPPTIQLTINTNDASAQAMAVSPADDNGNSNGTTPFTRTFDAGALCYVTAPASSGANIFKEWELNGSQYTTGGIETVSSEETAIMSATSATYTAVYGTTASTVTLTVQSSNPSSGVAISVTPNDNSSLGNGTTSFTRTYDTGTSVTLTAPATAGGYSFSEWTVNGAPQPPGQLSIAFTMDLAETAVAHYTPNIGYTLSVQSTPPVGLSIGSDTGQGGTTNYATPSVAEGTSVDLTAPATDPAGYTFSQWTVNGAAQTPGLKSITFTMDAAVTAVARYTANIGYTLSVQSTPPTGVVIASDTGQGGTTNYRKSGVAYGASVDLQAPGTDPKGYTFSQWTVNRAAQTDGEKAITLTMDAAVTAVAHYTANVGYALRVESTPPTGLSIGSSTGQGGTTNYTEKGVAAEASVNLAAPDTDPTGYIFSQWTVNGAAQSPGERSVTFTMDGAATAVAEYTPTGYELTVESTPPTGVSISSSTGQEGATNYGKSVTPGTSVKLQAPATDPAGYTFTQWTVNGAAETAGVKSVTFTVTEATTAVVQYTLNSCALGVESTPPTGLSIGSSTGHSGATSYTLAGGVTYGTSVNLQAPETDPTGLYTFSQWTLNGAAQTPGENSITFTMEGAATAVARYTANPVYTLSVQSTPKGQLITSGTSDGGITPYTVSGVTYGTSVNLQAPDTDPAGYTFSQWTVNGAAQTDGQKSITFTMDAAVTAVAHYTPNMGYTLSVQSTPPVKLVISSSTGHGGTTNYKASGVAYGTSVNLQAPATDPTGLYTFLQWSVNGAAQTPGQQSITFTMDAAVTAVAIYVK